MYLCLISGFTSRANRPQLVHWKSPHSSIVTGALAWPSTNGGPVTGTVVGTETGEVAASRGAVGAAPRVGSAVATTGSVGADVGPAVSGGSLAGAAGPGVAGPAVPGPAAWP